MTSDSGEEIESIEDSFTLGDCYSQDPVTLDNAQVTGGFGNEHDVIDHEPETEMVLTECDDSEETGFAYQVNNSYFNVHALNVHNADLI